MKKLLTILCLVLLSSYSYSQEVIPEIKTVTREGLVYHQSSTKPFTGVVETFHPQTSSRVRETYKDGELNGLWEEFWYTGQLRNRGNHKSGKKEGLQETILS